MVAETQTPTLAKIKNEASETDARALLYIAICEVCDFFNVGKNMNDTQIALTVDLILDSFWYLKITEIKYCFRRAMMREKLFDRIDGNIIIGWLRDYDSERTEEAMRLSDQRESQELNEPKERPGAISYEQYIALLREKAATDPEAAKILEDIDNPPPKRFAMLSNEKRIQGERDFKMWYVFNYLQGDKK